MGTLAPRPLSPLLLVPHASVIGGQKRLKGNGFQVTLPAPERRPTREEALRPTGTFLKEAGTRPRSHSFTMAKLGLAGSLSRSCVVTAWTPTGNVFSRITRAVLASLSQSRPQLDNSLNASHRSVQTSLCYVNCYKPALYQLSGGRVGKGIGGKDLHSVFQ